MSIATTATCEAEYIAAANALQEGVWLQKVIAFTNPSAPANPALLYVDKTSAVYVAQKRVPTERRKHIVAESHCPVDSHKIGRICVQHIPMSRNMADIMIKALMKKNTTQCCSAPKSHRSPPSHNLNEHATKYKSQHPALSHDYTQLLLRLSQETLPHGYTYSQQ